MSASRRVLPVCSGLATTALVTLLVTQARSQVERERAGVERASAEAGQLYDLGPHLSRNEATWRSVRAGGSGSEAESSVAAAAGTEKRVSVLVHFEPPNALAGKTVVAARRQAVKAWAGNVGGRVKYEYDIVLPNVINLRDIPESQLTALRQMPGVVKVEQDRLMHAHLSVSTPLIRALQSQITGAGQTADGSGVRVCIVDTGIDSDHLMYSSRIDTAAGRDFANNDNDPEDDNGHGSNVAGITVGGTGLSLTRCSVSTPFQGVAPEATLIGIKVLDQNGSGSFSDVIAGINYGADQSPSGGRCDVINMSLGGAAFSGNCDGDSAAIAANNAVNAGVVVVASSGNECNSNAMGTPACGSKVIAVGAVYDDDFPNCEFPSQNSFTWCCDSFCFSTCTDNGPAQDSLTCFSNASTTIDVAAPGCVSTSADNAPGGTTVSGECGTSQAAPHVTGLAALILSKDGTLTPAEVRQIIRDGAIDMGPSGFDTGYGWGRIDAINSLSLVSGGCTSDLECDDGLFCNGAETCNIGSGACQPGTAPNCNDGVGCTDDSCNEATDSCDNVANNANCDNGLFCDGVETCDAALDCQPGTAVNCDDSIGCTADSCNEATDACDNVPNNAACDDGLFCNGAETCSASLDCQAGSDPCPGQFCDEVTDTCNECLTNGDCDDGLFCNGAETCVGGACQAGTAVDCNDSVSCTADACNETTDACDNVPNNAACDDGLFCNGAETCDAALDCQAGTPPNCNDGIGCTDDSCNETTDSCDNVANDANCDNGLFCDGAETCDPALDCQPGTAVNCDDSVGCTADSCNEATDACDNVPNNAACDDGLFCNGAETCSVSLDCQAGSDPCPGQICDEVTDTCNDCLTNGDCDDGLFCNGSESCVAGSCQTGTAVDCNDGVSCTADTCNETTDACDNVPNNAACDDGLFCNGAETCDAALDCQAGTPPNCNDAIGCTDDSCNETTDSCDNVANNANCDNGLFCDGAETCDPALDCQPGTAVNCDDSVGCTADSCNEATDSCDNVPSDAACDDGLFCTGVETCDPLLDCQAGGAPCLPSETCNEVTDTCQASPCNNNGTCESGEDCNNCPADCPSGSGASCGNGVCEAGDGEDCVICPADCNGLQSGKPQNRFCCGGGGGQNPVPCSDSACTAGSFSCTDTPAVPSCCGDLVCEGNESSFDCPLDCGAPPSCGDAVCDATEDSCSCPADCGAPPATESSCTDGVDNDCDTFTDCNDSDCSSDPTCTCAPKGASCTVDSDCCSFSCKSNGTCR